MVGKLNSENSLDWCGQWATNHGEKTSFLGSTDKGMTRRMLNEGRYWVLLWENACRVLLNLSYHSIVKDKRVNGSDNMDWEDYFPTAIAERGYDYYLQGYVTDLQWYKRLLTAMVSVCRALSAVIFLGFAIFLVGPFAVLLVIIFLLSVMASK